MRAIWKARGRKPETDTGQPPTIADGHLQNPPRHPTSSSTQSLRSVKLLYLVSSSLGLTGLEQTLLRRVECERLRRVGDVDGGTSRHGEREGECERACVEKREKEV